jgi:hypothetical protein
LKYFCWRRLLHIHRNHQHGLIRCLNIYTISATATATLLLLLGLLLLLLLKLGLLLLLLGLL